MRITIQPIRDPDREIEITQCLVASIAEELWRRYGGNATLNWIEAEAQLRGILEHARQQGLSEDRTALSNGVAPKGARSANGKRTNARSGWSLRRDIAPPTAIRDGVTSGSDVPLPSSRLGHGSPRVERHVLKKVASVG